MSHKTDAKKSRTPRNAFDFLFGRSTGSTQAPGNVVRKSLVARGQSSSSDPPKQTAVAPNGNASTGSDRQYIPQEALNNTKQSFTAKQNKKSSIHGGMTSKLQNGTLQLSSKRASSTDRRTHKRDNQQTHPNERPTPEEYRLQKFTRVLEMADVDIAELRKLSWRGVPSVIRGRVWKLLLGYLPPRQASQKATLERKRREYRDLIPRYFEDEDVEYDAERDDEHVDRPLPPSFISRSPEEQKAMRQVLVDMPRTGPGIPALQHERMQKAMLRILYIWGMRHPGSGYVQGINDLLIPFLIVFLRHEGGYSLAADVEKIPVSVLDNVEADSFWCLTKLLDGLQDHYISSQPGLQRMIYRLQELIERVDEPLFIHIAKEKVGFMEFAFRWMNCLLAREVDIHVLIRLWDTCFAESDMVSRMGRDFENFFVYVCAALLCNWSKQLQGLPFHELMCFLQDLPTRTWGDKEAEDILAKAYLLKCLFASAPGHLGAGAGTGGAVALT